MKKYVFTTDVRSPVHGDFERGHEVDKAVDKAWLESMVAAGYVKHVDTEPAADRAAAVPAKKTKKK